MNRKEKVFAHIDKSGQGLEIGASYNPLAPKREGYRVHIMDHLSREQLIIQFKDHNVDLEAIEEVDFISSGDNYLNVTGRPKYYDWIIASHVIEHTPDFVGFLNECDTILRNDGVLSLIVPDKRYCFDHYRPITGISKIIDSHFQEHRIHTPGTVAEYFLNVVSRSGRIAWDSTADGELNFIHSIENATQGIKAAHEEQVCLDVHAWCFVPHSFRLVIHDLYSLGLISLQEVDFFPTESFEFYITLGRNGKGIDRTRLEMLEIIEAEINQGLSL